MQLSARVLSVVISMTILVGCAQTKDTIASGTGARATATATQSVNVAPVLTLGDEVMKAASRAAEAYLATVSLPGTAAKATVDAVKKDAVRTAVESGEARAKQEGRFVTEASRQELTKAVEVVVDRALAKKQGQ